MTTAASGPCRRGYDGRAFLQNTKTSSDLILFALPDSLTLVAGASQIRLESFLFTEQAIRSARDHLAPDGVFAMYNHYRDTWLIDRLAGTVTEAFGHTPCVDEFGGATATITAARNPADQSCASDYRPSGPVIAAATDNAPFLYFKGGFISSLYLWALAGILLLALPFAPRLILATVIAFLPIYLANVAFSKRFAQSGDSRAAFAANLLGAIVGGCLEYAVLVTGYRNLLIVVAALYLLAFALTPRAAQLA